MVSEADQLTGSSDMRVPQVRVLYKEGKGMQVQVMGASIVREHDGSLKETQMVTAHLPAWQNPLAEWSCSGHAWRELRNFADSFGSLPATAKGMFVSSFSM